MFGVIVTFMGLPLISTRLSGTRLSGSRTCSAYWPAMVHANAAEYFLLAPFHSNSGLAQPAASPWLLMRQPAASPACSNTWAAPPKLDAAVAPFSAVMRPSSSCGTTFVCGFRAPPATKHSDASRLGYCETASGQLQRPRMLLHADVWTSSTEDIVAFALPVHPAVLQGAADDGHSCGPSHTTCRIASPCAAGKIASSS